MTNDPDYLTPYQDAVKTHGPSFEATLWASKPKQIERFAVLTQMLPPDNRTVLDAGAGIADLAAFLHEQNITTRRVIALEAIEQMAAAAIERNLPNTDVHAIDFSADDTAFARFSPDVVYFSGSLNTFQQDDAIAVIKRAFRAARVGVAFNFLTTRHHKTNPVNPAPAVRFDPLAMLDAALKLTPNARFRQDYFQGHDATIALTHPSDSNR